MIRPFSKILQDNSLLLPSVISSNAKTINSFDKLVKLLEKEGANAFSYPEIFPTVCKMKDQIVPENNNVLPECKTRAVATTNPNSYSLFHEDYLLQGDLESALRKVTEVISEIATKLNTCIQQRPNRFVSNPLFIAVSIFLDTQKPMKYQIWKIYTPTDVSSRIILRISLFPMEVKHQRFIQNSKSSTTTSKCFQERNLLTKFGHTCFHSKKSWGYIKSDSH